MALELEIGEAWREIGCKVGIWACLRWEMGWDLDLEGMGLLRWKVRCFWVVFSGGVVIGVEWMH